MDKIQIGGIALNFIIYIFLILPIITTILFKKRIFKNKKEFIFNLSFLFFIEMFISIFLYSFTEKIFSLFTNISGIINYSIYCFKILFMSSSLYPVLFLVPIYIYQNSNSRKKTTILVFSKIVVHILFSFCGYLFFDTKGILFSFPLCDFVYFIIFVFYFLKIFS